MATYNLTHGGIPNTWGNVGYAMLPGKEVGPYDFMEPAAHFRPTTFVVNRYMWFGNPNGYYTELDDEAKASPALAHWLRNLRAEGGEVTTADKLKVIALPIDTVLKTVFFRNMKPAAGYTVKLTVQDKAGAVVHDFGSFDLSNPHLAVSDTLPAVYTEHTVMPMQMPSNSALAVTSATAALAAAEAAVVTPGSPTPTEQAAIDAAQAALDTAQAALEAQGATGFYLSHNHQLVVQFTAIPEGGSVDYTQFTVAAELMAPWLGAW